MAFIKAEKSNTGGKFLAYGQEGSGKSFFLLTFPKIAAMDSEAGLEHYIEDDIEIGEKTYNNLEFVDKTADLDSMEENLDALLDGEMDGQVETFGIDSESKFFGTMQVSAMAVEEARARRDGKDPDTQTISMQQRGRMKLINLKLQQAKISLSTRGVHVVSVAQEVPKYETKNKVMTVVGVKPDMHNSVPYDYDTIVQFFKEEQADGTYKYFGRILKDRTRVTNVGDVIENVTYDLWKPYFDARKGLKVSDTDYGQDMEDSTKSMESDAEKAEKIVAEFKATLKGLTDPQAKVAINNAMKGMGVSARDLKVVTESQAQELLDLAKTFK